MKLLPIIIPFFFLFQCKNIGETSTAINELNMNQNMNSYFIDYSLRGNFEIYFNGILIERRNTNGTVMNYQYLNQFIESSGNQEITLKIMPEGNNEYLPINTLNSVSLGIYFSENGDNPPLKEIDKLHLPKYNEPQKNIIYTWKVKMDVPYTRQHLKDYAESITKEDSIQLLKDVTDYYANLHNIINNGDSKEYLELYKKSIKRETETSYYTEEKTKEYTSNLANRVLKSKGNMITISEINIVIHPNNFLFELQTKEYETPLVSKDNEGEIRTFGLILYRSIKTGKLEIY